MSELALASGGAGDPRPTRPSRRHKEITTEPRGVRIALIGTVLALISALVFAPLLAVFGEALRLGWAASVEALVSPDARSAIRLTLIVAAIAVPLNAIFGIAAAWAIAKFEFRGKGVLLTLIDLRRCNALSNTERLLFGQSYWLCFCAGATELFLICGPLGWSGWIGLLMGYHIVMALALLSLAARLTRPARRTAAH